jgi:hypothetical protein
VEVLAPTEFGTRVSGAWSPSLDGNLELLTGGEWVGLVCAQGTGEACVLGYPAGIH